MHYPDLGTVCEVAAGARVRAVGWLADGYAFETGGFEQAVADKTERLAREGWMHVAVCGPHECELCSGVRAAGNFLVPGGQVIYVAPAMIAHYMRDHGYRPPAAFSAAVLACPEPTTDDYYAALRPFVEVFSLRSAMSEADFDRHALNHREHIRQQRLAEVARANRKGFTWD